MNALYAYAGRLLRVDLSARTWSVEDIPEEFYRFYLGSRGMNTRRLFDEVPRGTDPLGPENKLFFGVGPLNGTCFPGQRFNVSAKSPHTGILGDSNAGGFFGPELRFAGYDQLVVEGCADEPIYLFIEDDKVHFRDASHWWGRDVWETHTGIRKELGDHRVQVAVAGPGAERGIVYGGIFTNLVRANARTGMGTVMASKKLKAVAVRGTGVVDVADFERFWTLTREIDQATREHPEYRARCLMGTTRILSSLNNAGMLATKNHSTGFFPFADLVSGERLAEEFNVRPKGCYACTMPCSRYFHVREGRWSGTRGEGPEFESLAGFTSNIWNTDLPLALRMTELCNRAGLDTITVSNAIAFATECFENGIITTADTDGIELTWGNGEAALAMLHKIINREGFGDVFSQGLRKAVEKIGRAAQKYAAEIKGLELFMGEPRGIKAYGLGLSVASRGGDHVRAEPFFEVLENPELGVEKFGIAESAMRLSPKGKGRVVRYFEHWCGILDCLNICKNQYVGMEILPFDKASEIVNAAVGWDTTPEEIERIGERIINVERAFNVREGITRGDDSMPERFKKEPLPPECGPSAGSVFELEPMLEEYYEYRRWDPKTGWPTRSILVDLGLSDIANSLTSGGARLSEGIANQCNQYT